MLDLGGGAYSSGFRGGSHVGLTGLMYVVREEGENRVFGLWNGCFGRMGIKWVNVGTRGEDGRCGIR